MNQRYSELIDELEKSVILDASDMIEEFDIEDESVYEMDAELWMSPDGDRFIIYRYYDDEVELGLDKNDYNEDLKILEEEFEYVFKDWIKVGDL